ncbi:MAG: PIG-L family deacetylase, partial [Bacteroidales bacterium]|nr:PIG-L family deacetylase [Bacteroidales bacterium]
MGNLVATKGSAYNINIRVFNQIQHTITGWPGGKPNADDSDRPERSEPFPKRVIIFSPHPDDDVISMGGTFIRLVDQGHDVHVGYQTSGNIAVFDEDVIRFSDFVQEFEDDFLQDSTASAELHKELVKFLSNKRPGQVDLANVQNIKTLIRKAEAKAACRYIGLSEDHMHFLEMPFYQTGTVKKKPLSDEDVKIVVDMMRKYEPHQIFAAGDLSDPHGTHRVCLEAILLALEKVKKDKWMDDCYVWLYRGAWQEWDIAEVDMSVPLSPDELMKKRKAVFKHQSQKDQALFPGTDVREFWQRAEDRNRETAQLFDRLGMAEYEAIEAFVRYIP